MKLLQTIIFGVVLPLLIIAVGFAVLVGAGQLKPEPKKEAYSATIPRVDTVEIAAYTDGLSIDVDGAVVPFRQVNLTSEVAGRIKKKVESCRAGNFVKAGTLLFEIDPLDYELEVQQLTNEMRQAEINVHRIDVEIENTRSLMGLSNKEIALQAREVGRLRGLVSERIVTGTELDTARKAEIGSMNSLEVLKNQARTLVTDRASQRAAMDLVSTRLEKAQINLGRTKIFAPIDGVIVREMAEEDAYVQKGTTLVEIEDTSAVEVKCDLKMDQLYLLWTQEGAVDSDGAAGMNYELPKTPCKVTYRVAGRDFQWEGNLARYDGIGLNTTTRTMPCRVLVKDPRNGAASVDSTTSVIPPALVRGMFVRVSLQLDPMAKFAMIPTEALKPGNRIWKLGGDEKDSLEIKEVRVARRLDDAVLLELDDSFSIGDQIVISPLPSPNDGLKVRVGSQANDVSAEMESDDFDVSDRAQPDQPDGTEEMIR